MYIVFQIIMFLNKLEYVYFQLNGMFDHCYTGRTEPTCMCGLAVRVGAQVLKLSRCDHASNVMAPLTIQYYDNHCDQIPPGLRLLVTGQGSHDNNYKVKNCSS